MRRKGKAFFVGYVKFALHRQQSAMDKQNVVLSPPGKIFADAYRGASARQKNLGRYFSLSDLL